MKKGLVHTRLVSTTLIVVCIIVSAGLSGYFLDLYKTGVVSANQNPTAEISGGTIRSYPTVPITFDGSPSSDPDGEIFAYEWDFGDGFAGIGMKPTHSYKLPGAYTAVLKVTDNDGATNSDTADVIISEDTEGTGMYALVTVNELITNDTAWLGKLVRVAYATVTDAGSFDSGYGSNPDGWVKFSVSDNSTNKDIEIYCQGGANRPLDLNQGDLVNVSGLLDEYNNNPEINVRKDTLDRVKICPSIYHLRTLGELFSDRLAHNGELVRVENALVVSTWAYGWVITDNTTTESVDLYKQVGANASKYVNASDIITLQGVFTYYDYDQDGPDDDEWEIKVRAAAEDLVLRTWEFDYPPTMGAIKISPLAPSPFTSVKVNATVTDNVLITGVSLSYWFNGVAQPDKAMTKTTGNFYETSIPAAPHLTNVTYRVRATDNKGQMSNSSVKYYKSVDAPPVIADLGHSPDWVRPTVNVTVWAVLEDDGGIDSATVVYSNDSWATRHYAAMRDDGTAPDDIAGDGIFNASLGKFNESTVEYYVCANDTVGQNATSENNTFVSSFDQLPKFGGVYRDIELPKDTEDVRIIANVTDDFQLVNVTLTYNAGSGNVTVNMTKNARGNYEATVPKQDRLKSVSYYVNATDNATHKVTYPAKPMTYKVGYGVPSILYATGHGEETLDGSSPLYEEFADVVRAAGYNWLEADINDVDLSWVEFIVISDPTSNYTAGEMAKIQSFVNGGGGLLVMSETDYGNYGNPENCNPLLENLSVPGRFNDDSYSDSFYFFDYPSYIGATDKYHIPYFNYYHTGYNDSFDAPPGGWNAGDYSEWFCFQYDTTGITKGFSANKSYLKGWSMSTLVNIGTDVRVIQGTEHGYNTENSGALRTVYNEGSYPPILAAHTGYGTGRILYGGIASMLSTKNFDGWGSANNHELAENIIDWLVNNPLVPSPEVQNVQRTPDAPTSSQTVTISATVAGVGPAISKVTLRYSVNGSYYASKEMTLTAGTYSATIAKQNVGTVVTYYIQVVDAAGNYGFWPTIPEETGIGWYVVKGGVIDHIVLSEICYNPPGTDGDFEFVELYNPFPAALDISGWRMAEISGKDNYTDWAPKIPTGSIIPAFGYFLQAKSEYSGWGGDFIVSWSLGNNGDGFGRAIFLHDDKGGIVDRCCYDDHNIGYLNSSLYEGWPFTDNPNWDLAVPSTVNDADGSMERLPGFTDLYSGNWQDTGNNSNDFVFRKFVDAQGTASPPEYPPWTASITSPFLLPDDHPKFLSATKSSDSQTIVPASEPVDEQSVFVGPPEPALMVTFSPEPPMSLSLTGTVTAPAQAIPRRQGY